MAIVEGFGTVITDVITKDDGVSQDNTFAVPSWTGDTPCCSASAAIMATSDFGCMYSLREPGGALRKADAAERTGGPTARREEAEPTATRMVAQVGSMEIQEPDCDSEDDVLLAGACATGLTSSAPPSASILCNGGVAAPTTTTTSSSSSITSSCASPAFCGGTLKPTKSILLTMRAKASHVRSACSPHGSSKRVSWRDSAPADTSCDGDTAQLVAVRILEDDPEMRRLRRDTWREYPGARRDALDALDAAAEQQRAAAVCRAAPGGGDKAQRDADDARDTAAATPSLPAPPRDWREKLQLLQAERRAQRMTQLSATWQAQAARHAARHAARQSAAAAAAAAAGDPPACVETADMQVDVSQYHQYHHISNETTPCARTMSNDSAAAHQHCGVLAGGMSSAQAAVC
jgi:hypothetical protein